MKYEKMHYPKGLYPNLVELVQANWINFISFREICFIFFMLPCSVWAVDIEPEFIETKLAQNVAQVFEVTISPDTSEAIQVSIDLIINNEDVLPDKSMIARFDFPQKLTVENDPRVLSVSFTPPKNFRGELDATLIFKIKNKNLPLAQIERIPLNLVIGKDLNPRAITFNEVNSHNNTSFMETDELFYRLENSTTFSKDIILKFDLIKNSASARDKVFFSDQKSLTIRPYDSEIIEFSLPPVIETTEFINVVTLMVAGAIIDRKTRRITVNSLLTSEVTFQRENQTIAPSMFEINPGFSNFISFLVTNNSLYSMEYTFDNFTSSSSDSPTGNSASELAVDFLFDKILLLPNTTKKIVARVFWGNQANAHYSKVRIPVTSQILLTDADTTFEKFIDLILINNEAEISKILLFDGWGLTTNGPKSGIEVFVKNIGNIPIAPGASVSITVKNSDLKVVQVKKITLDDLLSPGDTRRVYFELREGLGEDMYNFEVSTKSKGLETRVKRNVIANTYD